VRLVNIAQPVPGFHEVIARVQITVVLEGRSEAAGGGVDAQQVATEQRFERYIEQLHEDSTDVMAHPLFEDAR